MRIKNQSQRSRFLLSCAEQQMSYARVVVTLKEHHFEEISEAEWKLWVNYYLPLVETNPLFKSELINNNRTLSWFARTLSQRYEKNILS